MDKGQLWAYVIVWIIIQQVPSTFSANLWLRADDAFQPCDVDSLAMALG